MLEIRSLLFNRYRIEGVLGQGGMGAIYVALDESLGVRVAVKENAFSSEEYIRQFRREATILASLRHPNLPRVTDHFVIIEQGQYLVMDYIEGQDLKQMILERGKLLEEDVLFYAAVVCDALSYLHSRQPPIVHRDIKPGNIRITPNGQIFLVDFGLAKEAFSGQVTSTGAQALTPGYAPPEQYGQGTDTRSDIYALAATMYAALANKIPEDGLARLMGSAQLVPLRQLNPGVTAQTASMIEKGMAVDANRRYQTAEIFKQAILGAGSITSQKSTQRYLKTQVGLTQPAAMQQPPTIVKPPVRPQSAPVPQQSPSYLYAAPVVSQRQRPSISWLVFLAIGAVLISIIALGVVIIIRGKTVLTTGLNPTKVIPEIVAIPSLTMTMAPTQTKSLVPPVKTIQPSQTQPSIVTQIVEPTRTPTQAVTPWGGSGVIAFASNRSGSVQIWLMDIATNKSIQLTNMTGGVCQPSWSPDGWKIVATFPCPKPQLEYKGSGLVILNGSDGGVLEFLPQVPGGDYDPAWSPDGKRIAFVSLRDGPPHLYVYNLEEKSLIRLSNVSTRDSQPSWSPDGNLIAYQTTRLGNSQIWIIKADDISAKSAEEFSILSQGPAYSPDWSPNGKLIIFSLGDSLPWLASRVFPHKGSIEVEYPEAIRPVYGPRISPDGNWVVLETRQGGNAEIYLMAPNGGLLKQLTDDSGMDFHPDWRP